MKRWIIRSFFIGVLLLFMLVWTASYFYVVYVEYETRSLWKVESFTGYAKLEWRRYSGGGDFHDVDRGWITSSYRYTSSSATNLHYLFRFDWLITRDHRGIIIPFSYPTLSSAVLLWLAWRRTGPKPKGRAFPVELNEPLRSA